MKKVRLVTNHDDHADIEKVKEFEVVEKVPEVGDYWIGTTCEVIAVEPVKLDLASNDGRYDAYKISYINCGFEEEKEDPSVSWIAVEAK